MLCPCVHALLTRVLWSALDDTWVCDTTPRRPREMVNLWQCLLDCSSVLQGCPCYYELEDAAPACCAPNKNSATLGDSLPKWRSIKAYSPVSNATTHSTHTPQTGWPATAASCRSSVQPSRQPRPRDQSCSPSSRVS